MHRRPKYLARFSDQKLKRAVAFANSPDYNPSFLESPRYGVYHRVFEAFVEEDGRLVLCPHFVISRTACTYQDQRESDDCNEPEGQVEEEMRGQRIPDFTIWRVPLRQESLFRLGRKRRDPRTSMFHRYSRAGWSSFR